MIADLLSNLSVPILFKKKKKQRSASISTGWGKIEVAC